MPSEDEVLPRNLSEADEAASFEPRTVVSINEKLEENIVVHLLRIRKFCYIMIGTSFIIPVLSWFIDPYHFVFYQSILILVMQFYVAFIGIRGTKTEFYSRLEYFRKIVHAFYIYYLFSLILNQIAGIIVSSEHNYKNCGTFTNNRVCINRTGLMTTQLVTLLYSPGLDLAVWIFYRYLLTVLNDCKAELIKRRL